MNGSDANALEKALAEYEDLRDVDKDMIAQAKASLELLWALKDENDPERLEKALRHVLDVKLKHTGNVQKAEDILVSHYEKGRSFCIVSL